VVSLFKSSLALCYGVDAGLADFIGAFVFFEVTCRLHVLREPADTLAVALAHDDGAHEDLDGANALERDLALASCKTIPVSIHDPFLQYNSSPANLLVW
jgi:hypothetical protein